MKKIKDLWRNNRVLFVLFIILFVCFIAIVSVALSYFVGSKKSPYGNRLENQVKLPNKFESDLIKTLESDSLIKDANVRLSIRTIYITMEFNEDVSLVEAEGKATSTLDTLSEDVKGYYDVNFILSKEKGEKSDAFTIMGSKNVNGSGLIWNNNNIVEEKE